MQPARAPFCLAYRIFHYAALEVASLTTESFANMKAAFFPAVNQHRLKMRNGWSPRVYYRAFERLISHLIVFELKGFASSRPRVNQFEVGRPGAIWSGAQFHDSVVSKKCRDSQS